MTFPLAMALMAVLVALVSSHRDPFNTLVAYEAKQRKTAGVGDTKYHLLPLRLGGDQQHFLQMPTTDQIIIAEAMVHWITPSSSLKFPEFDLQQKVRIIIEEETLALAPAKAIMTKEFLTQTGFKINITAGRRYRWRVESLGNEPKMVEIALATRPASEVPSNFSTPGPQQHEVHSEVEFLKQMRATLERVKISHRQRPIQQQDSLISSMWAWMSGAQILSLLVLVTVQLTLFQKFMLPSTVI